MYPLSVRKENEFLASTFGYDQGYPRFQWRWGADITMPIVQVDDASKVVYVAHCACGVGVSVHTDPRCNWTVMRPHYEICCLVPQYAEQWVMTRWVKPEVSRDDWESTFGSLPYPTGGHYLPVADPAKTLAIVPGQMPTRDDTILVMAALTEHYAESAFNRVQRMRDKDDKKWQTTSEKNPDMPMGDVQRGYYDMIKDMFPGLKDEYGKTTQFHAQTGIGPSPAERKKLIIEP